MNKPYGYKETDVISLAEFIAGGGFHGKSLSQGFKDYAKVSGKAAGSVRNLYYALAKFSRENAEFTEKYLGGRAIAVDKGETFSEEENTVISRINEFKSRGVSVRHATICLAGGDVKKALRYQNKYRSVLKQGASRIKEIKPEKLVSSERFLTARLKAEINRLSERLAAGYKRENARLLKQVAALKAENEGLIKRLGETHGKVMEYFRRNAGAPHGNFLDS